MKFGACIDTLYTELSWYDRIAAAKKDGFDAIEFWDWRNIDIQRTLDCTQEAGIIISGFNGDADYSLVDPEQKNAYLDYLYKSLQIAKQLDSSSVTVHSNALGDRGIVINHYNELSMTVKLCSMYDTLKAASKIAEEVGVQLNLEALNIYTDHVGNFLATTQMASEICRAVASPNLKILFDIYHMQINEGNLINNILMYANYFGHIHIADVPGRHEPGTGEVNYVNVLRMLNACGFSGIVGCELFPQQDSASAVHAIMQLKAKAEGFA